MTRLFAAAMLFTVIAVPAFACEFNKSAATDSKSSTVASQPSDDQSAPPQSTPDTHKPS